MGNSPPYALPCSYYEEGHPAHLTGAWHTKHGQTPEYRGATPAGVNSEAERFPCSPATARPVEASEITLRAGKFSQVPLLAQRAGKPSLVRPGPAPLGSARRESQGRTTMASEVNCVGLVYPCSRVGLAGNPCSRVGLAGNPCSRVRPAGNPCSRCGLAGNPRLPGGRVVLDHTG